MHWKVAIGLVLALACAAGASVSGLWKQKGAVEVDDVDIRRPVQTAVALFRSKWFAIGWLAAAAFTLHLILQAWPARKRLARSLWGELISMAALTLTGRPRTPRSWSPRRSSTSSSAT